MELALLRQECNIRVPDIPAGALMIAETATEPKRSISNWVTRTHRIIQMAREPYKTIFNLDALHGFAPVSCSTDSG